jgi:hypothetical protein
VAVRHGEQLLRTTTAKAAATYVITTLTSLATPITFLGYEVGVSVTVGTNMYGALPTSDLLLKALTDHGSTAGRPAWGPLMTQMAALGSPLLPGTQPCRAPRRSTRTALTHLRPSASGPHQYVVKAQADSTYAARAINSVAGPWSAAGFSSRPGFQGVLGVNSINVGQPGSLIAIMRATDFTGC